MQKLLLFIPIFLAACTPQSKFAWEESQKELRNYNATEWLDTTGIGKIFFASDTKTQNALETACANSAENRVITYTGASEPVHYRHCAYSPSPLQREPSARISK